MEFNVAESDFFILESRGIVTYEGFSLRVPSKGDLEEFLRTTIVPSSGYKGGDGVLTVFPRVPQEDWNEYKTSEDAASLRKLWLVSHEISKSEVERLATGDESARGKIHIQAAIAMENEAIKRGMPAPGSDVERPSLYCLARAAKTLVGPGASYEYVAWECFISMEEEAVLARAERIPKYNKELVPVLSGTTVSFKDKKDEAEPSVGEKAEDLEAVRRYLDLRARAFDMLGVASFKVYKQLTEKYISRLIGRVPQGMRAPTVEEVRRFDRTLHEELLRWVGRSASSLDEGVIYHVENMGLPIWKLLDPVVKGLPDQGIEADPGKPGEKKRKRDDDEKKAPRPEKKESGGPALKKCLVCGERHTPFCALPANFRKNQREKEKAAKAAKKAAAKATPKGDH